jgi:hypothetical protein
LCEEWINEEQYRVRDPLLENLDNNTKILHNITSPQQTTEHQQNRTHGDFPAEMCLSTCCIYLSGISGPRLEKYKTVVQQLGGQLSETITPQVTHIVSDTFVER